MKKVDLNRVAALARQGLNGPQIAERMGVRRAAIYAACKAAGTTFPEIANGQRQTARPNEGGQK